MLMRTDPFRELDRFTQQVFGNAARPAAMPMDAYRQGDSFYVCLRPARHQPGLHRPDRRAERAHRPRRAPPAQADGAEMIVAERPYGTFTRQVFLGETTRRREHRRREHRRRLRGGRAHPDHPGPRGRQAPQHPGHQRRHQASRHRLAPTRHRRPGPPPAGGPGRSVTLLIQLPAQARGGPQAPRDRRAGAVTSRISRSQADFGSFAEAAGSFAPAAVRVKARS